MIVWKILFWFAVVLMAYTAFCLPFDVSTDIFDLLSICVTSFGLITFYGYAYQKNVASKGVALVVFYTNALVAITTLVYFLINVWASLDAFIIWLLVGIIALNLVFLVPQYKYAFNSRHLWEQNA